MRLGTQTNNLMSHVMTSSQQPAAKVGDGCTICLWTDRHAGTVVKVTKTQIHVQRDIAERIDNNGMSDQQNYAYTPNPEASVEIFRKTKQGYRNASGNYLAIGYRKEYHDYSF